MLIIYIPQIVGSVAKGCPLLEYFDFDFAAYLEYSLHAAELIALSKLPRLRSVFINMYIYSGVMTPTEKESLRVSLDAIAEQGLLEVSIFTIARSYIPIKIIFSHVTYIFLLLRNFSVQK